MPEGLVTFLVEHNVLRLLPVEQGQNQRVLLRCTRDQAKAAIQEIEDALAAQSEGDD